MGKRRSPRTGSDIISLDSQVAQISKQLGIKFKGGKNYYQHFGRHGEQITVSAKDGIVTVSTSGLPKMPLVVTRVPQHLGVDELADIIRRRLDMSKAA